jgi:hypothetical protein
MDILRDGELLREVFFMPEVRAGTKQSMAKVAVDVVLLAVVVHVCKCFEQAHDATHLRHLSSLSSAA